MRINKKIAIVDYQLSNLFSVKHACEFVGLNAQITSDPKVVEKADGLILPGMGAFGDAMKNLKKLNLDRAIHNFVNTGKPFLGVCLGQQLIFERSEEFGNYKGLSLLEGTVKKIPRGSGNEIRKVPHVGWNRIKNFTNGRIKWEQTLLKGVKPGNFMYFVHSFYVEPKNKNSILATTDYENFKFCSVVSQKNIFATQFHPEKSGVKGITIYKNFKNLIT